MKKYFYFLFTAFLVVSFNNTYSQQKNDIAKEITFLQNSPVIDGTLDDNLKNLPVRKFFYTEKSDDKIPTIPAEYRIAYGMDFLYLYIEYKSDSLTNRDRAYQNGDGFHLVIANPKPNGEAADEFYVLGFSPGGNSRFIWYKDINLVFSKLDFTKISYKSQGQKIGIELLLPWKDLYPYQPFLSGSIGFNLCFVKAINEKDAIYYFVKNDEKIQWEQSKRLYEILKFERPGKLEKSQAYAVLNKNNIVEKEKIDLSLSFLCSSPKIENLLLRIESLDGSKSKDYNSPINFKKKINKIEYNLNISELPSEDYKLIWEISGIKGEIPFTILPDISVNDMNERLKNLKGKIKDGSLNSLQFLLNDISEKFNIKKPYDACYFLRLEIITADAILNSAENGEDIYATDNGLLRRAYLSKFDNTLQPYTVKIPKEYKAEKKYPLIVFLHGSGEDDRRSLIYNDYSKGECVELAPNGRGTSNCYSTPESLKDIYESITDVINNYSIDTSKIILEGFSMGGYGVYRVYYEFPKMFRAAAVFSGHPDLASKWMGGEQINFLDEKNLSVFKNIPMFVFHGTKDRNCDYEVTCELIDKLKNVNANVMFCTEDVGHSSPSKETMEKYYTWLNAVLNGVE